MFSIINYYCFSFVESPPQALHLLSVNSIYFYIFTSGISKINSIEWMKVILVSIYFNVKKTREILLFQALFTEKQINHLYQSHKNPTQSNGKCKKKEVYRKCHNLHQWSREPLKSISSNKTKN